MAEGRRLPSRKRSREAVVDEEEASGGEDEDQSIKGRYEIYHEFVTSPLVSDAMVHQFHRQMPSWLATAHIEHEVEIGTNVAQVHCPNSPVAPMPPRRDNLLLRAMEQASNKRPPPTPPRRRNGPKSTPMSWAPRQLHHLLKVLEVVGLRFVEPSIIIHQTEGCRVQLQNQMLKCMRRYTTTLPYPCTGDNRRVTTNYKTKRSIMVDDKGDGTVLQLAREVSCANKSQCESPLVTALMYHNLLGTPATMPVVLDEQKNTYVKIEWTLLVRSYWLVVFRLAFVSNITTVDGILDAMRTKEFPCQNEETGAWLRGLGASDAHWRLEVEVQQPITSSSVTRGLCLHSLILRLLSQTMTTPQFRRQYEWVLNIEDKVSGTRDWLLQSMPMAQYARLGLFSLCRAQGLDVHRLTGFPLVARPRDYMVSNAVPSADLWITPKANGRECVVWTDVNGLYIITRNGDWRMWPWLHLHSFVPLYPLLMEGEVWNLCGQSVAIAVYDCLVTPILTLLHGANFVTRQHCLRVCIRKLQMSDTTRLPLVIGWKPAWRFSNSPYRAIERCTKWIRDVRFPCDGLILYDNVQKDYINSQIWKIKHHVSVDMAAIPVPNQTGMYELMGRAGQHCMRSIPAFRRTGATTTTIRHLPVLLSCANPQLCTGDRVVELSFIAGTTDVMDVHLREPGKQANFCSAIMNMIDEALLIRHLSDHRSGHGLRFVIRGPLRVSYYDFLRASLVDCQVLLDVGGGCGGTLPVWQSLANLKRLIVFDPDEVALQEYNRRLGHTTGGVSVSLHQGTLQTCAAVVTGKVDVAFLGFSLSQIVDSADGLLRALGQLYQYNPDRVIFAFHDHARIPEAVIRRWEGGNFVDGTRISFPFDVATAPEGSSSLCWCGSGRSRVSQWVCTCSGGGGWRCRKLRTHLLGTRMMSGGASSSDEGVGVEEWGIDWTMALATVREHHTAAADLQIDTEYPFAHLAKDAHWLLLTMCLVTIRPRPTPAPVLRPGQ